VPYISLVFREMWDTTILNPFCFVSQALWKREGKTSPAHVLQLGTRKRHDVVAAVDIEDFAAHARR
jgi:hypothetical protein